MKKIILEQMGNIVLLGLLIAALIQAATSSKVNKGSTLFEIHFGVWFLLFLLAVFVFWLIRQYFSRRFHNYDLKKGELSAADEREQLISERAALNSYRTVIFALIVALCGFFWLSTIISDLHLLQISGILGFGGCILVGFITYLISWLILDRQ